MNALSRDGDGYIVYVILRRALAGVRLSPSAIRIIERVALRLADTASRRAPISLPPTRHNRRYLATKRDKLGHLLDLKLGET